MKVKVTMIVDATALSDLASKGLRFSVSPVEPITNPIVYAPVEPAPTPEPTPSPKAIKRAVGHRRNFYGRRRKDGLSLTDALILTLKGYGSAASRSLLENGLKEHGFKSSSVSGAIAKGTQAGLLDYSPARGYFLTPLGQSRTILWSPATPTEG